MPGNLIIERTNSNNPGFQILISRLDRELREQLQEIQSTYDQYNLLQDLPTVILISINEKPAACGCFKRYSEDTVEIKRMFVEKEHRGEGLSKRVLDELEKWAVESGFKYAVLETSVRFKAARGLYTKAGYHVIDNYDQYAGLEESVCMRKKLS